MKNILHLFPFLVLASAINFSLKDRCSCSEYSVTVCQVVPYCSVVSNACTDLQCSLQTQTKCTGVDTEYKCGWNTSTAACETKTYSCSDITDKTQCSKQYGYDCSWQTSSGKCINFTCSGIDESNCDKKRCSFVDNKCGDPTSVDCATLTTCDGQTNGSGQICAQNDSKVCKSYSMDLKNCSDYSDLSTICSTLCTYDSATKTCSANSCSGFKTQTDCTVTFDYSNLSITTCYWTGTACTDATAANIESFDTVSCIANTIMHYTWSLDSSKCVQCASLSTNPIFNSSSNSVVFSIVVIAMLLLE